MLSHQKVSTRKMYSSIIIYIKYNKIIKIYKLVFEKCGLMV